MNHLRRIYDKATGEEKEAIGQLVHSLAESMHENRKLLQKVDYLAHDVRTLKKHLYGSSSEKSKEQPIPDQLEMSAGIFDEFELCAGSLELEKINEEEEVNNKTTKKQPGRKPLPKNLPRQIVEHDLSVQEKICECGHGMECIGNEVSEQLDYHPARVVVLEHHCKKYGCSQCNEANKKNPLIKAQLKTANKPLSIIPKGIATPSLLAHIVTHKFCDHLPLYRQETIFQRLNIDLSRQTMSEWMLKVGHTVIPLINLLTEKILDYDVAYADETTLQVLHEPGRKAQTKSYMWCFIGGRSEERIIIYQYHATRKGAAAEEFFAGYEGAIHSDGYAGYNKLHSTQGIVGINCWAHVRRKFIEAYPSGKAKGVSGFVVREINKLYEIEASLKAAHANEEKIKEVRENQSKPILVELKKYLDEKKRTVPPKSKLGEAITYACNRWPYLMNYLQDGRYEIDNNRTERAIKPFVMGRKNWLFSNSQAGAHCSARLFSIIETAKANEVEPSRYLEYIFTKLPTCTTVDDYEALLPWRAKAELEKIN